MRGAFGSAARSIPPSLGYTSNCHSATRLATFSISAAAVEVPTMQVRANDELERIVTDEIEEDRIDASFRGSIPAISSADDHTFVGDDWFFQAPCRPAAGRNFNIIGRLRSLRRNGLD
jgi:hypothetical protein